LTPPTASIVSAIRTPEYNLNILDFISGFEPFLGMKFPLILVMPLSTAQWDFIAFMSQIKRAELGFYYSVYSFTAYGL